MKNIREAFVDKIEKINEINIEMIWNQFVQFNDNMRYIIYNSPNENINLIDIKNQINGQIEELCNRSEHK